VNIVYVVKRFPKVSETFVLREIEEVIRQGDRVMVCSLLAPHSGEPVHPGADALRNLTVYVPKGPARPFVLVGSSLWMLLRRPRRAGSALAWSLSWAVRERRRKELKRFAEAAYLARRLPADAEHLHAHFAHGATSVALLLSRLTGLPFSFTGHAKDIFRLVRPPLLAAKIAEAKFAVAVSDYTRAHMCRSADPAHRTKVVTIRNGIDRSRFAPRAAEPTSIPEILSVSRLVEKKGLDTLVDACAVLAKRGREFRCLVVGEGPVRARLEQRADQLGVADWLELPGSLDQTAVQATYREAAVFALPCRRTADGDQDGLPVAIMEAMSVGVPVVTTPLSGIPEVVRDGETGLLVSPGHAEELADAIERVLVDPELRARLVRAGETVVREFELSKTVHQLRQLFHERSQVGDVSVTSGAAGV